MEWMVVTQSLEEELELEKNVRDVQNCSDRDALQELCVWTLSVRGGKYYMFSMSRRYLQCIGGL